MDSVKKQAIRAYIAAVSRGDGEGLKAVVTQDYTHEFLGTTMFAGTRTLAEILERLDGFTSALVAPGEFTFHEMVEEGDLVMTLFSGKFELVNGKRFDGDYAAAFKFRGDKILSLRELVDTKLTDDVLGS